MAGRAQLQQLKQSAQLAVQRDGKGGGMGHSKQERRPLFRVDSSDDSDSGSGDSDDSVEWRPRPEPVDTVMDGLPFGTYHWRVLILFSLAQSGFCLWVLLPVFINPVLVESTTLTSEQLALCSTAFFGGWAAATPLLAKIADRHGRRRMGLLYYALGILVGIRVAFVTSFASLLATRTVLGGATCRLPYAMPGSLSQLRRRC